MSAILQAAWMVRINIERLPRVPIRTHSDDTTVEELMAANTMARMIV